MPILRCSPSLFDAVHALLTEQARLLPCNRCKKLGEGPVVQWTLTRTTDGTVLLEAICGCLFAPVTRVESYLPDAAAPSESERIDIGLFQSLMESARGGGVAPAPDVDPSEMS